MHFISPKQAAQRVYDVIIVGGGIMGSIVARRLSQSGHSCLIVEAGKGGGARYTGYLDYLDTYHKANAKIPNSPYPSNPNAPEPTVLDPTQITPGKPSDKGYFVQEGPLPFRSSYTTYLGGTTLHWLGTTLRMLPEDFSAQTVFGVSRDWPIEYDDLRPWYAEAEREIGVSANVEEQAYLGVSFEEGYVYPMHALPSSYSDQQIAQRVDGMNVHLHDEKYTLQVRNTPVGRNGIPNDAYADGEGYHPIGAVGDPGVGKRCMGNSSCVPICPIQAKYTALKTLNAIDDQYCDVLIQSVVSELDVHPENGRIQGVFIKHYADEHSPEYTTYTLRGKRYVLAAHAVNNAMILLASGACQSSGLVGRHLMDHPELLTWGLSETPLWPLRGPLATSGIEDLRSGAFRDRSAPFRMEMGNDGWLWPAMAPNQDVERFVNQGNYFGRALRQKLREELSRQFRFGILVEQTPEYNNRVTLDPSYRDALGNYRPVIQYNLSDYTRAGFEVAYDVSMQIFQRAGIRNYSVYPATDPGYFTYKDKGYVFNGAGHFAGTHCMGNTASNSVVNTQQRTWDHENLYLVGCGNMVTLGTSNPTLTAAALTCWAAENILQDLRSEDT